MKTINGEQLGEAIEAINKAKQILRLEDAGTGIGEDCAMALTKLERRLKQALIVNGVLIDKGGTITFKLT